MTTASIYYRADDPRVPDFVLINGQMAAGNTATTDDPDGVRIVVDAACRTLGWKAIDDAPIVRQADGRGTIRIEPLTADLEKATAYINVRRGGQPWRVAVDGRVAAVTTKTSLTSKQPSQAIDVVDGALTQLGYRRVSGLTVEVQPDGDKGGIWACSAETRPGREWRDEPTLVRISDDTARALTDMADRLGIPADRLADTWIAGKAADARSRYDRFMEPGYILDHGRIKGFLHDGTPRTDPL